jgi:arsenate reductase
MTQIYHNPRCSKSRQTLALLEERGIHPQIIEYLATPPTAAQLDALIDQLDIAPHALLRKKEAAYRQAGLTEEISRGEIVQALVAHPVLLERPIVLHDGRAAICRPPEKVLEIL